MLKIIFLNIFLLWTTTAQTIEPQLLSKEVVTRARKVPEYNFIIQLANEMKIKVYLFGGTASAFAHYVRWDLEREAGDTKYQPERFDYDFTSIYRGNQDLDIVIDSTPDRAKIFEDKIRSKFPHFVGLKDAWEVRLLKLQKDQKPALLGDVDFQNQHSDSNSTGLILLNPDLELQTKSNKQVFFDLKDWENENSLFLTDVSAGKITYLYSSLHKTTERFKSGHNDPILSVIRYIAKLTQYEVEPRNQDIETLKVIISNTNFSSLSEYNQRKFVEFGLKALLNSPNVEYATNLLESLGLRSELIQLGRNYNHLNKPASFWFSKEPLRSQPLSQSSKNKGPGKTAKELGIDVVSHETRTFQAYENITRSTKNNANVFISRTSAPEEAAAFGEGFYTKVGRQGATGSGITIRFHLHPEARDGIDFIYHKSLDFVVVKNKNALLLIHENLNLTFLDFIKIYNSGQISNNDKGLIEKLKRKFTRQKISDEEAFEIYQLMKNINSNHSYLFQFWSELGITKYHIDYAFDLLDTKPVDVLEFIKSPSWKEFTEIHERILEFKPLLSERFAKVILTLPQWSDQHDWFSKVINNSNLNYKNLNFLADILSSPQWSKYPYLLDELLKTSISKKIVVSKVFETLEWLDARPDLVQKMIDDPETSAYILRQILNNRKAINYNLWITYYLKNNLNNNVISESFNKDFNFSSAYSATYYDDLLGQLEMILESGNEFVLIRLLNIFSVSSYHSRLDYKRLKKLIARIVDKKMALNSIVKILIEQIQMDNHRTHPEFNDIETLEVFDQILKSGLADQIFIKQILSKEFKNLDQFGYPEKRRQWIQELILRNKNTKDLVKFVFSKKFMSQETDLLNQAIRNYKEPEDIIRYVLPLGNNLINFDFLVSQYLETGRYDVFLLKYVLVKINVKNKENYLNIIFNRLLDKYNYEHLNSLSAQEVRAFELDYFLPLLKVIKTLNKKLQLDWISNLIFKLKIPDFVSEKIFFDVKLFDQMTKSDLSDHTHLLDYYIQKGKFSLNIINYLSLHDHIIKKHPEWINHFLKNNNLIPDIIRNFISNRNWNVDDRLINSYLMKNSPEIDKSLAQFVFSQKKWAEKTDWIEILIDRGHADENLIKYTLSQNELYKNESLMKRLVRKPNLNISYFILELLRKPDSYLDYEWIRTWLKMDFKDKPNSEGFKLGVYRNLVSFVLPQDRFDDYPDLIEEAVNQNFDPQIIGTHILSKKRWMNLEWAKKNIDSKESWLYTIHHFLSRPHWALYPELIEYAHQKNKLKPLTRSDSIFKFNHWNSHPELVAYVGKPKVSLHSFSERMKEISFTEWRIKNLRHSEHSNLKIDQTTAPSCIQYLN